MIIPNSFFALYSINRKSNLWLAVDIKKMLIFVVPVVLLLLSRIDVESKKFSLASLEPKRKSWKRTKPENLRRTSIN